MIASPMNLLQVLIPLMYSLVFHLSHQKFAESENCIKRSPQFVAHVGEKAALGEVGGFRAFLWRESIRPRTVCVP